MTLSGASGCEGPMLSTCGIGMTCIRTSYARYEGLTGLLLGINSCSSIDIGLSAMNGSGLLEGKVFGTDMSFSAILAFDV